MDIRTRIYNTAIKNAPTILTNIDTPSEDFALDAQKVGVLDILAQGGRNLGVWYWNITEPETAYQNVPLTQFNPGNPRVYCIPGLGIIPIRQTVQVGVARGLLI